MIVDALLDIPGHKDKHWKHPTNNDCPYVILSISFTILLLLALFLKLFSITISSIPPTINPTATVLVENKYLLISSSNKNPKIAAGIVAIITFIPNLKPVFDSASLFSYFLLSPDVFEPINENM